MGLSTVVLAFGSNIDDRLENLNTAERLLSSQLLHLVSSSTYESFPVEVKNQRKFLNRVVAYKTSLCAEELLKLTQETEFNMGRTKTIRFGPRNIDIDIILYEDLRIRTKNLTIPHSKWMVRDFVYYPLKEISNKVSIIFNELRRIKRKVRPTNNLTLHAVTDKNSFQLPTN